MENLYTLKQFIEEQKLFTEGSLRNMIFKQHENGLSESGAIKRFGRKILIDKIKFFEWINSMPNRDFPHKG